MHSPRSTNGLHPLHKIYADDAEVGSQRIIERGIRGSSTIWLAPLLWTRPGVICDDHVLADGYHINYRTPLFCNYHRANQGIFLPILQDEQY